MRRAVPCRIVKSLEALYDATGGPDWIHNENWRTDAPLREWYGVEADDQGRVVGLRFVANGLTGRIPRELGGLANLQSLVLRRDPLTGPIPSEFGDLANLRRLHLRDSDLTGPIPRELGSLANLRILELNDNDFYRPDPGRAGQPHGPASPEPGRESPHRPDHIRAGQSHQSVDPIPRPERPDRLRSRPSSAALPACRDSTSLPIA